MRRTCLIIGIWVLASAGVMANVWNTQAFTEWTDRDVQKVLTDSPWAGRGSVTHALAGGERSPIEWRVTVAWRSALPIKQGLVRDVVGLNGAVPADLAALLRNEEPFYMISVGGLPSQYGRMGAGGPGGRGGGRGGGETLQSIAQRTQLTRGRGKSPLRPVNIVPIMLDADGRPMEQPAQGRGGVGGGGGRGGPQTSGMLVFYFSKDEALTLEDREVEFASVLGSYNVKRKFRLRDMTVNGQLAL